MFGRVLNSAVLLAVVSPAWAQTNALYLSRPGQILRLDDLNSDGDYLDFAEKATYAAGLPMNLGAMVKMADALYVVDVNTASIHVVRDLNGDGDALDFAEVLLYVQLSNTMAPMFVGLTKIAGGDLLTIDPSSASLYRVADLNGDGDAFDSGELTTIAGSLTSPLAIATRPDGRLLVTLQSAAIPIRILQDHTEDGDYFDFAENISYAENSLPGSDLVVVDDFLSLLSRTAEGKVMKLQDLTRDSDVLDFSEIVAFAEGLPSPARLVFDGDGDLLVACQNPGGSIYRLSDLNDDGDSMDFAEAVVIAEGATQVGGMVFVAPPQAGCIKGDADGNSTVNTLDIVPIVDILLGNAIPPDPCPADTNNDGLLDARDIKPFIELLL